MSSVSLPHSSIPIWTRRSQDRLLEYSSIMLIDIVLVIIFAAGVKISVRFKFTLLWASPTHPYRCRWGWGLGAWSSKNVQGQVSRTGVMSTCLVQGMITHLLQSCRQILPQFIDSSGEGETTPADGAVIMLRRSPYWSHFSADLISYMITQKAIKAIIY